MKRRLFVASSVAATLAAATAVRAFAQSTADVPTPNPRPDLAPVTVLYAGSLVDVMEHRVASGVASVGLRFLGEGKGSLALAREIESGLRPADVFISADTKVLDGLGPSARKNVVTWYATFAATRLVLGYARSSPFAKLFADVARGKAPLTAAFTASNLRIGRTDPTLDPKGYRSILAMRLLELDGTLPSGFAARVLGDPRNPSQILPEETLLTRLETGDVDLAFLYATESVARGLPKIELPKTANLGDPAEAATYAKASLTIGEVTRTGSPATYAVALPAGGADPAGAQTFVTWLLGEPGRAALTAAGVDVLKPVFSGDRAAVPPNLRAVVGAR